MSKVRAAAAIAKGMSITFKEMFQPTEVENYPDGKGPMRGAKFQERFRGKHQLQRDENGLEKCVACFFCAYCVEACPTDAITHGHGFELASLNATNLVMRKEDLLVPSHKLPDAVRSEKDEAEMLA